MISERCSLIVMYMRKRSAKTVLQNFIAVAVVPQIHITSTDILMMRMILVVSCKRSVLSVPL